MAPERALEFYKKEPKLYQLLLMSTVSEAKTFDDIYGHLGSVADECLQNDDVD